MDENLHNDVNDMNNCEDLHSFSGTKHFSFFLLSKIYFYSFLDVNNDDLIMAQEKQIEREIANSIPLVGPQLEVMSLQKEYSPDDNIYQQKVLVRV